MHCMYISKIPHQPTLSANFIFTSLSKFLLFLQHQPCPQPLDHKILTINRKFNRSWPHRVRCNTQRMSESFAFTMNYSTKPRFWTRNSPIRPIRKVLPSISSITKDGRIRKRTIPPLYSPSLRRFCCDFFDFVTSLESFSHRFVACWSRFWPNGMSLESSTLFLVRAWFSSRRSILYCSRPPYLVDTD